MNPKQMKYYTNMLMTPSKIVYQFIMLALHFTTIRKYKVPQRIMDIVL